MVEDRLRGKEILLSRAACCVINNHEPSSAHASDDDTTISSAFAADGAELAEALRHLSPSGNQEDMCTIERADADSVRDELQKRLNPSCAMCYFDAAHLTQTPLCSTLFQVFVN